MRLLLAATLVVFSAGCRATPPQTETCAEGGEPLRVAAFNIEDVRTADVLDANQPRLKRAAALIQQVRPDILLVSEMTYDEPGAPDVPDAATPGLNGHRFADAFLAVSQGEGLEPLRYRAVSVPTNTGRSSGYDLDRDGDIVTTYPAPVRGEDGAAGPQTPEGRRYGNDSWGFGIYPGQYAFTLLVREDLTVLTDSIRTFRDFRWGDLPGHRMPLDSMGTPWYAEAATDMRLSSKNHADIPVRLPDGRVLHILASHPTPPAFDGPEKRNVARNHDEIRLWAEYLDDAPFLVDDAGRKGGLPEGALFVVVGDLNADPDEGNAQDAIAQLLTHPRVQDAHPTADSLGVTRYPDLDRDDTAGWGMRADYVLPSADLCVRASGLVRPDPTTPQVSDHFMVWVDVR